MKTRLFAMLAVCSLLLSIPMVAQDGPTDQHWGRLLEAIKNILDLTDSQAEQLVDLRRSHLEQVHALRIQIRELQQQKADLLNSSDPNPAQVGAIVIQQRDLHQQVQAANQSYREAALVLLTLTQQETVAQIQEALRLAPQARPLAAFGLVQVPGRQHRLRRRLRHRFGTLGGEEPTGAGPAPLRLLPHNVPFQK